MIVHRLSNDFFDDNFRLIAIHTTMEDYRLVYFLNKNLKLRFSKSYERSDLKDTESGFCFPYFRWYDENSKLTWHCFANRLVYEKKTSGFSLFDQVESVSYLINSKKKIDFFVKIDGQERIKEKEIISKIVTIPNVSAVYTIEAETLNSKHKLIFQEC